MTVTLQKVEQACFACWVKESIQSLAPQKTKVYLDAQPDRFRSGGLPGAILPDADGTSKFAKLLQSIHLL